MRSRHDMNKYSGRLPIYLVSLAAVCILLFGIRAAAPILNPILLAVVITITVLPIPGHLHAARAAGLAGTGADHPGGGAVDGAGHRDRLLLSDASSPPSCRPTWRTSPQTQPPICPRRRARLATLVTRPPNSRSNWGRLLRVSWRPLLSCWPSLGWLCSSSSS